MIVTSGVHLFNIDPFVTLFIIAIIVDGKVESEASERFKNISGGVLIAFFVIVGISLMVVVDQAEIMNLLQKSMLIPAAN